MGPLSSVRVVGSDSLQYSTADGLQTQTFDHVFAHDASQEELYIKVGQPMVDQCLKGYNGAILCYGQTGSGKVICLLMHPKKHNWL